VTELADKLRTALAPSLEAGEELQGVCVSTQVGLFKGRMVALGVTPGRVIVQGLTRKFEPDGPAILLTPQRIAQVSADGLSGGWPQIGAALVDKAALTLKLKTTDGEKLKLNMMRGTGPLGGLGGGETQRQGVDALGAWFARNGAS
jgi:hypothetical protein